MSDGVSERAPAALPAPSPRFPGSTKPAAGSGPTRAPEPPGKSIYLTDVVVVRDLASAVGIKPFKVVAELLALGKFKNADDEIDFETAALVAAKHGCRAERPPPGVLVL